MTSIISILLLKTRNKQLKNTINYPPSRTILKNKKEMQNFVYGIAHINELLNICAKRDDVNVYGITFYNCLFLGRCELNS